MKLFNKSKNKTFPYNGEEYRATYTCRHVINKEKIYYVSHDNNGDWTFLCEKCAQELDLNMVLIVALCDLHKIVNIRKYNILNINEQCINDSITKKNNDEYEKWLEEVKDGIVETNINRNGHLRSDFSGIKIYR